MQIGYINAAILGEKLKMSKKKSFAFSSWPISVVYKLSDHISKIWAPHGLISPQVPNYTKFKYELKIHVTFERQ